MWPAAACGSGHEAHRRQDPLAEPAIAADVDVVGDVGTPAGQRREGRHRNHQAHGRAVRIAGQPAPAGDHRGGHGPYLNAASHSEPGPASGPTYCPLQVDIAMTVMVLEVPVKALVYHGPGQKSWDNVPDPSPAQPTDIVVRVDTTTICGTDLHILKGDVPAVVDGRILGHEAVGTVTAVGSAVNSLAEGDRVLVPAITSCGRCSYCKRAMPSHCQATGGIGWIFGHLIDGTQAEYARVPFAETSVHRLPEGVTDERVIFLADILPTGYEVGVKNGRVKPGDVVVVVGAGPVGLAAIQTASLSGAAKIIALEPADTRREHSLRFGAD